MSRIASWLTGALLNRQTWTLELFLAVQALCWGAWLLMPWSSFDVVPGAFTVLGLVPEPVWGVLFAGHGVAHLVALWKRNPALCRRAALMLAALWLAVLVSLLLTIPLATSTPIYGMSVLGCFWIYVRLDVLYGARR